MGAGITDSVARRLALVAVEIIENDDIAGVEGWCQALLYPTGEGNAVDRPIEHEGRDDAIMAQAGEEGQRLRLPMRYSANGRIGQAGRSARRRRRYP